MTALLHFVTVFGVIALGNTVIGAVFGEHVFGEENKELFIILGLALLETALIFGGFWLIDHVRFV